MITKKLLIGVIFSISTLFAITDAARPFRGVTEPVKHSTISATVPGRVSVIHLREGDYVKKGQIILELENESERLEVARRKLIHENKSELKAAELQMNMLKIGYESTQKLFQSTQSVSEEELREKEIAYQTAKAELEALSVAEKREAIEYKIAVAELRKREIRSPYKGVIVKVFLHEGESANSQEPLVRVVNVSKCRFTTYIASSTSLSLNKGNQVSLSLNVSNPPVKVVGTVEFISPVVDPSSGLREVRVLFNNANGNIQPGVSGSMSLGGVQ